MSTLILDRSNLRIASDGKALALYEDSVRCGSVPLRLIDRVVLQGRIARDSGVLTQLAEAGTAVLMLSPRKSRRVAVMLGPAHQDAAIRIAQCQMAMDQDSCAAWAKRLVSGKIRAQYLLLKNVMPDRPDRRKSIHNALDQLSGALQGLDRHPGPNVHTLLGIEGAAARAYFKALCCLFPASLGFCGRNRRPPRDPVNACLSLGYTLLHFEAVRAAHVAGLVPLIGVLHRPRYGREWLASDLIEPLRPKIDDWVRRLFRDCVLRQEHFSNDLAACLLNKNGRKSFYHDYEVVAIPLRRRLRRQCGILACALRRQGSQWCEDQAGFADGA